MNGLQGISTIQPQGRLESIKGGLSPKGREALDELIKRKGPAAVEMMLSILPGSGEVISAQESGQYATKAYEDIGQGKIGAGLRGLGESIVAGVGAVPFIGEGMRLAGTAMDVAGDVARQLPGFGPELGMVAFHGTPHKFAPTTRNPLGEFDLGKMGTGEGAQAYGHGIYLAEGKGTAKYYQEQLSASKSTGQILKEGRNNYSVWGLKNIGDSQISLISEGHKTPKSAEDALFKYKEEFKGHLLEVDLPDEQIAKMLDWDKPLNEQPAILKQMKNSGDKELTTFAGNSAESTGEDLYKWLTTIKSGEDFSMVGGGNLFSRGDASRATSDFLKTKGMPGIKYQDQASRGYTVDLFYKGKPYQTDDIKIPTLEQAKQYAKEKEIEGFTTKIDTKGTRNFVLFDPSIATITKRD